MVQDTMCPRSQQADRTADTLLIGVVTAQTTIRLVHANRCSYGTSPHPIPRLRKTETQSQSLSRFPPKEPPDPRSFPPHLALPHPRPIKVDDHRRRRSRVGSASDVSHFHVAVVDAGPVDLDIGEFAAGPVPRPRTEDQRQKTQARRKEVEKNIYHDQLKPRGCGWD